MRMKFTGTDLNPSFSPISGSHSPYIRGLFPLHLSPRPPGQTALTDGLGAVAAGRAGKSNKVPIHPEAQPHYYGVEERPIDFSMEYAKNQPWLARTGNDQTRRFPHWVKVQRLN